MKKIIIFFVIIFSFSNAFAEINFDDKSELHNLIQKNKVLKIQAKKYEKTISEFEKKFDEINGKYIDLKSEKENIGNNIDFLGSENNRLKNELANFKRDINSDNYKEKLIKNYFSEKTDETIKSGNTEEGKIFLAILYLSSAFFLYLFFLIYTLPLRLLRAIWRKITGYKDPLNNNDEFNSLIKKYRFLKIEKLKSENKIDNLLYEIKELEIINKKTRKQNSNLKYEIREIENNEIRKKIKENKKNKDSFIFEDIKNNFLDKKEKNNKHLPVVNKLEEKLLKSIEKSPIQNLGKNILNKKTENKSFLLKGKTDLFGKKKKEKFSLGGNKKGGLFD